MSVPNEFEDLLDAMPDGVVVVDTDGRIALVNGLFERMSGYPAEALVGEEIEMLVPAALRDDHRDHREGFAAAGYPSRSMGAGLDIKLQRSDGSAMPVDIALSRFRTHDELYVFAAVRDITARRRVEARVRAVNEVAQSILTGGSSEALLHQVARSAAHLVGAPLGAVVVPESGDYTVRAAHGTGADRIRGMKFGPGFVAEDVLEQGRSAIIDDAAHDPRCPGSVVEAAGIGPVLVVPLWVRADPFGALLIGRESGEPVFNHADAGDEEAYAAQAAVALEYARAQEEVQRLSVLEDRERIARELHDTVIQRLFAAGMSLQATTVAEAETRERLDAVVDDLDGVIREIRSTIFALESAQRRRGVRAAILQEVEEWSETLGFAPQVRFDGPVDAGVDDDLAGQLLGALREMLSNVAKHAGASHVAVDVSVDHDLQVAVVDDGVGLVEGGRGGNGGLGLRNLERRAQRFGGEFEIGPAEGGGRGTRASWRVPLPGT